MSTPTPDQVSKAIAHLRSLLDEVEESYRWMHPLGYVRGVGEAEPKVSGANTVSRPTETIAAQGSYMRSQVKLSAKLLRYALGQVVGAKAALDRAANSLDRGAPTITNLDEYQDPRERMVTDAELRDLKAAQVRRYERGEGIPG